MCIASLALGAVANGVNHFDVRVGNGLSYREIENIDTTVIDEGIICSICLENIEPGTVVKVLPGCSHRFHVGCIGPWLLRHPLCPYCRATVEGVQER